MFSATIPLPGDVKNFIGRFGDAFLETGEVWLFGSRADGTASHRSDWDLLALCGQQLPIDRVAQATEFRSEVFSLFVARGDDFQRPWPRSKDGCIEQGSFSRWEWTWEGSRAIYTSNKEGRRSSRRPAVLVWRRGGGIEHEDLVSLGGSLQQAQSSFWCDAKHHVSVPKGPGARPPQLHSYPEPRYPVRLLFVSWNPPTPFGGFWSLKYPDPLRLELCAILNRLGQVTADDADAAFLAEFMARGFYLVHAVKCWTDRKYPGFGRGASRAERKALGLPRLWECVDAHLADEIRRLSPQRVCALGELAFLGLQHLYRKLDGRKKPTDGFIFEPKPNELRWPMLFTCLP